MQVSLSKDVTDIEVYHLTPRQGTSIEFARYTSASGLFVPVAIQNMASSPTRYTPAPQKDNMVYRVLFYVEGTTAPPADISTNSPRE